MTSERRHVTVEEYAMLRNLESIVGSLLRVDATTLRQLQKSWLWSAMREQCRTLLRYRAEVAMSSGQQEEP
jgi:hypothetical protein